MECIKKHRWILALVACSFIIRILIYLNIMNTTPFADYFAYKEWVYKSYSVGLNNVYHVHSQYNMIDVNQPPGTIYVLRGSYEVFLLTARVLTHFLHLQVGATAWINDNLLIFFFRLPSIIADLLLGFLIYGMVKSKTNERLALASSALYLFGPPVIYNSTVWGQIDSVNNVFFYLSLLFLAKKQAFPSVFCFALSLFIKLSLLSWLPLYILIALFGGFFKKTAFLKAMVTTGIIIWMLCIPFSTNPFWIIDMGKKVTVGISQDISSNAFNFWWLMFNPAPFTSPPPATTAYYGLPLHTWATLLFGLCYLPVLWYSVKVIKMKKLTVETVFFLAGLTAFASFLFLPKMHERYLYPVLPLFITWTGMKNKYWITTALLSVVHFLNLYVTWNPSLFLFGRFEEIIMSQNGKWLLSFVTIVIFGFYYGKICPTGIGKYKYQRLE